MPRKKTLLVLPLAFACVATGPAAFAQNPPDWLQRFPPHHVVANVYYVGSKGLASYLITTPQGHIFINSSLEANVPLIRESVGQLGFHFADVISDRDRGSTFKGERDLDIRMNVQRRALTGVGSANVGRERGALIFANEFA